MKRFIIIGLLLLVGLSSVAQIKPVPPTSATLVALLGDVTGKQFMPDTAFAALTDEDEILLAKEPVANWGLPQESGKAMMYYNLVVGTRSYQLIIVKLPKTEFPTATLLRFTTPKSKPEPIARGVLKPKEEKSK